MSVDVRPDIADFAATDLAAAEFAAADVGPPDFAPGGGRDHFGELLREPHFDRVVAANRLYLAAAVADPLGTEREYWALTSRPTIAKSDRFSTLSMGGQETFTVFVPIGDGPVTAHVFVTATVLASFGVDLADDGLEVARSPYFSGGEDQVEVFGTWRALAPVLADRPLRTAARDFAERLMSSPTPYARYHDRELAARVLGRS